MQIVLIGNRVVAHGENCFLCMGGTVICEETGKAYPNATVAEVETIPADIDTVGYEYHAGVFVPCAPYGFGAGEIMVACEDCGTPKRSKVTADADGGLHIPGYLTGAKIADETAAALGLTDATVNGALEVLSESLAVKETQIQVKTVGVDFETGTFPTISDHWSVVDIAETGDGVIIRAGSNSDAKSTDGGKTWSAVSISAYARRLCECNGNLIRTYDDASQNFRYYNSTGALQNVTNKLPSSIKWGASAYGNGSYVILSYNNSVSAAWSDTINGTYTATTMPKADWWEDVVFANGVFVALGRTCIVYSYDGKTWATCNAPSVSALGRLAFGNGVFVAILGGSQLLYSYNGVDWFSNAQTIGAQKVAFGGGKFYAQGYGSASAPNGYISTNGLDWTPTNYYIGFASVGAIGYAQGKFWVISDSSSAETVRYAITYDEFVPMYRLVTPDNTDETEKVAEALGSAKIATGTYTGTGNYGSNNKNSLTFEFEPKVVMISCGNIGYSMSPYVWGGSYLMVFDNNNDVNGRSCVVTLNGNTMSWYVSSGNADYQLNGSSRPYYYIAIG